MRRSRFFMLTTLLLTSVPMHQVMAQVTPNHVYQVTDTIVAELNAFHESDFSEPGEISLDLTPRKPRHVLQKAQEVYIKVQTLRTAKGLTGNPVEPIPVRDVTPGDVKGAVDKILIDLRDLDSVYDIEAVAEAALLDGKTPTDVYMNLAKISASLDGLGIPSTVPNDVHRTAETIVGDLKLVLAKKGLSSDLSFPTGASAKSPGDVYDQTHVLLAKLKALTNTPDYSIPGGVVLLNKASGGITPAYVMDALNNVLAEVGAIKQKSGQMEPTKFAPLQSGQTPSNVFDSIKHAEALIDALAAGGAE